MFWGCWSGIFGKGPVLFWEKDWGYIDGHSYSQKIIPLVCGWFLVHDRRFLFQEDNATSHNAPENKGELQERGIPVINWPPNSPDLNIIEDAWNIIKGYISKHHDENIMGDALRQAIYKA